MLLTDPIPFDEAIASRVVRTLLPTELRTDLLQTIKPEVLARSRFSAGVMEAELLQKMFDGVDQLAAGKTDRATQRAGLKRIIDASSYVAPQGEEGTIADLRTDKRLNLFLDFNVAQMSGAGTHLANQDPTTRDQFPASELYRARDSEEPRDWEQRWRDAAEEVGDEGALRALELHGRMVALNDSRIWYALSQFGQPYPPFDFGSGMGKRLTDRDDAIDLGLIDRDTQIAADDLDINQDLKLTPQVRSDALKSELSQSLAGVAEFVGGVLALVKNRELAFTLNTRAYQRDDLGRFAGDGGSLSIPDNIERGKNAIDKLRRQKGGTVEVALQVPGLGDVEIPWGRAGHTAPNAAGKTHTDGYGLSHIIAKHGDAAADALPEVLASGKIHQHTDPAKREITHRKWKAVVGKTRKDSAWVITNFEAIK